MPERPFSVDTTLMERTFARGTRLFAHRAEVGCEQVLEETGRQVRDVVISTSPVDTGRLKRSWGPVTRRGRLTWGFGTPFPYAPILEYGGYTRTGPRTVALGGGDLGEGFVAGSGIYSTQAPLGFVRRALAQVAPVLRQRLTEAVARAWREG